MKISFLAVVLLLYHFCFDFYFWHTDYVNFDFNWCSVFIESYTWKRFESSKSLLVRFAPRGKNIPTLHQNFWFPPTSYCHLENPVYREKIEICIWFLYWCKTRKHWERKILFLVFCLLLFSFWPLAVAGRVLWNRVCLSFCPSFCLSGRFMEFYQ